MKILFCINILFGSLTAITSHEKVFDSMNAEERRSFFGTEDESLPKYEIVELVLPSRTKRSGIDPLNIMFNAFGVSVTTNLHLVEDNHLINTNLTTIWTAEPAPQAYQGVAYTPQPIALEAIGDIQFFHNVDDGSSLTRFTDDNGEETFLGIIKQHYTVKSVPEKFVYSLINIKQQHVNNQRIVNSLKKRSFLAIFRTYSLTAENIFKSEKSKNEDDHIMYRTWRNKTHTIGRPDVVYPKLLIVPDTSVVLLYDDQTDLLKHLIARLHSVNTIFRQLKGPEVHLNIAGIIIPSNDSATPYITTHLQDHQPIRGDIAARNARSHFLQEKNRFPHGDRALIILLTRNAMVADDMDSGDLEAIHGFTSSTWKCDGAAAITKYTESLETMYILAHELGHMFGMENDGEEHALKRCEKTDGFLMTDQYDSTQKFEWSPCTHAAFQAHFSECLYPKLEEYANNMPGSRLSLDGQCDNLCGSCRGCCTVEEGIVNCTTVMCHGNGTCAEISLQPMEGSVMILDKDEGYVFVDQEWVSVDGTS